MFTSRFNTSSLSWGELVRSVFSAFSPHATCLTLHSHRLSGDFPGYFHKRLEEDTSLCCPSRQQAPTCHFKPLFQFSDLLGGSAECVVGHRGISVYVVTADRAELAWCGRSRGRACIDLPAHARLCCRVTKSRGCYQYAGGIRGQYYCQRWRLAAL